MATINIDTFDLKNLLEAANRHGAKQVLIEQGLLRDSISQRKAWELYGRAIIESLRNRGLITRTVGVGSNRADGKDNSKSTYSRAEIDAAVLSLAICKGRSHKGINKAIEGIRKPA